MVQHKSRLPRTAIGHDPLAWLLFHKLSLSIPGIVLIQLAYGVFEGILIPQTENYSPTIADYMWYFFLGPLFVAYYASSYREIPALYHNIKANHVLKENCTNTNKRIDDSISQYNRSLWFIISLISSITIIAIIRLVQWKHVPPAMISSSLALYLSFIPQFITAYICSISVIRDILTTYQINQLFSHCDVHLQPLHPDNAAGFGFIGSFFQRFTIIVIAIGMWISIYNFLVPTLQNRPINLGWEILLTAALYLIVAPTSLILPLWSTHLAMKKEKDRLIASISEQFDKEFCVMPANISDSTKALRQWLDKTKALEDTKKVVENTLHTWPVSNRALREFSLSASLPIITSLVSLFIEFF